MLDPLTLLIDPQDSNTSIVGFYEDDGGKPGTVNIRIESFRSFANHRLLSLRSILREEFLNPPNECEWRWNY